MSGVAKVLPAIGANVAEKQMLPKMVELLRRSSDPRVLIIGSGSGKSSKDLASNSFLKCVAVDFAWTPGLSVLCDAHDLPFFDGSFDGVVASALLEHVVDPWSCVEEIHRVLKRGGLVYADTPFMQQVHGGAYDFTRFTFLGHRRLFRRFDEIDSGASCGPGMALAWSFKYFLQSLFPSYFWRRLATVLAAFTSFWLKYVDYLVANKPRALDAASAYFFLGQRSETVLPDRDLVHIYEKRVDRQHSWAFPGKKRIRNLK